MHVDLMHEGIRQLTALFKNFCLYSLSRPSRFVQSGVWRDLFEEEQKIKVVAHVVVLQFQATQDSPLRNSKRHSCATGLSNLLAKARLGLRLLEDPRFGVKAI